MRPYKFHKNTSTDIYFYSLSSNREYVWLSNFHKAPFTIDAITWPTVENYFQAQKSTNLAERDFVRHLEPWQAKKFGRTIVPLRKDWESIKEKVMRDGSYAKYSQNDDLRDRLIATGTARLHEDSPTDHYWGINGQDRLGIILHWVRVELARCV